MGHDLPPSIRVARQSLDLPITQKITALHRNRGIGPKLCRPIGARGALPIVYQPPTTRQLRRHCTACQSGGIDRDRSAPHADFGDSRVLRRHKISEIVIEFAKVGLNGMRSPPGGAKYHFFKQAVDHHSLRGAQDRSHLLQSITAAGLWPPDRRAFPLCQPRAQPPGTQ